AFPASSPHRRRSSGEVDRAGRARSPLAATAQPSALPLAHPRSKGQVLTASTTPPVSLPEKTRHYIGGEFVDSIDGEEFDVLNPVTNEAYIKDSSSKKADIEAAVAAAKTTFDEGP